MTMKMFKDIVVLFSICTLVCGCAHKCVYYAVVEMPSMKTLYEVTSDRNSTGPFFLNTDDKAHVFYTSEPTWDQKHNFIRCYDYVSGYKWEADIPLIVASDAIWCVGKEVYVGGSVDVWRGLQQAADLYGCVCLFKLDRPNPDYEIIVGSEPRGHCCREIAALGDRYLVFLFGPYYCGEEFSCYVIFDPVQHRVVEKKDFKDEASRLEMLSRCTRKRNCPRAALGKFVRNIKDEGCLIFDNHLRLVSKLSANAIERQFLLLGSQDEVSVHKSTSGNDFAEEIRNNYKSKLVNDDEVVFWTPYGSWFVYDIKVNQIVDSGVIKLDAEERLIACVDLNCFLIRARRLRFVRFLIWDLDFSEAVSELVFIENGKQKRKSIPGLERASRLANKIYCLDFKG